MNKNDSERVANYLENLGYKRTADENKADVLVTTTCGVRQSADDRVYGLIPRIKRMNPKGKIILTGCLANREDVQKRLGENVDIWMPITELPDLKNRLHPRKSKMESSLSGYFRIKPKYESKFSAFVPIGNGCDNFCTYCVVPYARGRETYRSVEEVVNEAKNLIKKGYKEITLIAQNVNSYISPAILEPKAIESRDPIAPAGRSGMTINFAQLLKMVNDIPGDFWLRFSTSHPKDMSDELIETMTKCEKLCHHIHLPAQAGDNKVLNAMNRKYTKEHYMELIKKIRKALNKKSQTRLPDGRVFNPPVSITTDIIVGFPGETKNQFNETAKLFREVNFDMAYIAQYSPRPGTVSYKMDDNVSRAEKKRREEELNKILRKTALKNNKAYLNKIVEVLIDGKKKDFYLGKTKTAKTVVIKSKNKIRTGDIKRVKIYKVGDFGMEGEISD